MRLSGEGDAGQNGGPAGDLYVIIHVKPSDYFHRDGVNVYTQLEVSPAQAVLGDEVEIKTIDGTRKVSIPQGLQSGDRITIKGEGVPVISNPSMRGDHIVVVSVKTPTHISNEERRLYESLYEIETGRVKKQSVKDKIKGAFK